MGLKYNAQESADIITAMGNNIKAAQSVLTGLEDGVSQIITALYEGSLSGVAYNAANGLFEHVFVPTNSNVSRVLQDMVNDLDTYKRADNLVAHYGVLDEDSLNSQIGQKKAIKAANDILLEGVRIDTMVDPISGIVNHFTGTDHTLARWSQSLENDIQKLQQQLDALQTFSDTTSKLFTDSLNALKYAMQGVTVLNNTTLNPDGTLPADFNGVWLVNLNNEKLNSDIDISSQEVRDSIAGMSPTDAALWWANQSPEEQKYLIDNIPQIIGNLPGIPYGVRDQANRITLDKTIASLAGSPESEEYNALLQVRAALDKATPGVPYQLITLILPSSTSGRPLAAVSVGDLDKAQYASYMIPGMKTNVRDDMVKDTQAAFDMRKQMMYDNNNAPTAVVAWIGYDTPNELTESSELDAMAGGKSLARELDGFAASRAQAGNPPLQTSVVAHSYGTAVACSALTQTSVRINSVVLEGSPGIPKDICSNASQLNVDHVYASTSSQDAVAPFGKNVANVLGADRVDPTSKGFGATDLSAEASKDGKQVTGHGPILSGDKDSNTNSYWDPGTTTYNNAAAAATGHDELLVKGGTPDDRQKALNDQIVEQSEKAKAKRAKIYKGGGAPGKARV